MKKYKNILFDLDGTMYKIIWPIYKKAYFTDEAESAFNLYGIDIKAFYDAHEDAHENIVEQVYKVNYSKQQLVYQHIANKLGITFEQIQRIFDNSKSENLEKVKDKCITLLHDVIKACEYLHKKGYRLFLATNSYFSRKRILERLAWTGLDSDMFEFINDWTQTDSVKPNLKFFDDLTERFGLNKEECLLVGNDKEQDGGCLNAGIDMYLVTNDLQNPTAQCEVTYQGDQTDFYNFVINNF